MRQVRAFAPPPAGTFNRDEAISAQMIALLKFLGAKGWIVDISELRNDSTVYSPLHADRLSTEIAATAFVIPLLHQSRLLGFCRSFSTKYAGHAEFRGSRSIEDGGTTDCELPGAGRRDRKTGRKSPVRGV